VGLDDLGEMSQIVGVDSIGLCKAAVSPGKEQDLDNIWRHRFQQEMGFEWTWVNLTLYTGYARASEIRSLRTKQLFGLMDERTWRSSLQRSL